MGQEPRCAPIVGPRSHDARLSWDRGPTTRAYRGTEVLGCTPIAGFQCAPIVGPRNHDARLSWDRGPTTRGYRGTQIPRNGFFIVTMYELFCFIWQYTIVC